MRYETRKDVSLEVVRFVAVFLVLFTHTGDIGSKLYLYMDDKSGWYYYFCICLDVVRISSVPLFLMISGAVLLGKNESFRILFTKRILRMVAVLLIFSVLQYLYLQPEDPSISEFIKLFYQGTIRGGLWYMYLYICYLFLLPFLRPIAQNMNVSSAMLLLFITTIYDAFGAIAAYKDVYAAPANYLIAFSQYNIVFPLLGYWCYNAISRRRLRIREIIALVTVYILVVFVNTWFVNYEYASYGDFTEAPIWRFNALLTLPIFALTLDLVKRIDMLNWVKLIFVAVGNASFGIYLCENFIERYTRPVNEFMYSITNNTLVSCCIYLLVTIAVGTVIFNIIKKIPGVNKFI